MRIAILVVVLALAGCSATSLECRYEAVNGKTIEDSCTTTIW